MEKRSLKVLIWTENPPQYEPFVDGHVPESHRLASLLSASAIATRICGDFSEMTAETSGEIGAVILASEVLNAENLVELREFIANQPSWSQLPVLLLSGVVGDGGENASESKLLKLIPIACVLDRPLQPNTFVSLVRTALKERALQNKIHSLTAALDKSRSEAERANRAKSDFLANMSHEIRTPLGAVLGFSEMLIDSELSSTDRQNYASAIGRNGKLLLALVNDILDLAKVESGRVEIENIEISLKEFFSEVISALQPLALIKNVSIELLLDQSVPDMVKTDPLRLKQILTNIAGNAVKFSRDSKVVMKVSLESANHELDLLTIDVVDRGVGIPPLSQARLFQPFVQADTSSTREYGGTGLGLVLSRQLARLMGGDLTLLKSEPRQGSTFRISLVVGQIAQAKTPTVERLLHRKGSLGVVKEIAGLRLLLVEDSPDNRVLIGRILKNSGANLETANDGLEGLTKALADHFDVVIMDVQMPRLDGYQAASQLRQHGYDGPIIALTAHALKGERERCLSAGYNEYLTKPVDRKALVNAIAQLSSTRQH